MKRFNKKIARQILQDNPDYDWVAQDNDGDVYIFTDKPCLRIADYTSSGSFKRISNKMLLHMKGFKKAIYSREELFPCESCEKVKELERKVELLSSDIKHKQKKIEKLEQQEPTVEVGDYFITLSRPVKRYIVRSNPHDTLSLSLKLICIDEYETHTKTKDRIIHLIKSGELRKLQKGEVIRIEV